MHVLSSHGGPRPWFGSWDPSTGYYWLRQRSYLIDQIGWAQPDVESLDDATDRILSHLEDPRPAGPVEFSVRGLVMGYVQSGKTANFCALVAKAADLGYKLVIVLSGIHNSLRLQTQRRIARALGIDPTGVAMPEAGMRWISLTTDEINGDFRPGTIDANVLQGNERVLLVVKKNATVLRRLTRWMENRAPASLPVLIIDDEADQASINTGGNRAPISDQTDLGPGDVEDVNAVDELDPSMINGLVRLLISSFHRVCYVAYTATPFANVLINHLAIDREVFEDLSGISSSPCPGPMVTPGPSVSSAALRCRARPRTRSRGWTLSTSCRIMRPTICRRPEETSVSSCRRCARHLSRRSWTSCWPLPPASSGRGGTTPPPC